MITKEYYLEHKTKNNLPIDLLYEMYTDLHNKDLKLYTLEEFSGPIRLYMQLCNEPSEVIKNVHTHFNKKFNIT